MRDLQGEFNSIVQENERNIAMIRQKIQSEQRQTSQQTAELRLQLEQANLQLIENQEQASYELNGAHEKMSELKLRV